MDYKEKIKEILKDKTIPEEQRKKLEEILLAAEISNDERIRKELINYFTEGREFLSLCSFGRDEIIAWLEKQESLTTDEEKQGKEDVLWCIKQAKKYAKDENEMGTCWFAEQWLEKQGSKPQGKAALEAIKEENADNANKVEAKQKSEIVKGKWYVCNTPRYTDFVVGKAYYCPKNGMLRPNENEIARYVARDCFRLWSITDAKDGDILSYKNEVFIVKKSVNLNILYYCCYDGEHFIIDSFYSLTIDDINNIRPATKEQRELLFKKMHEAGYEWGAEMKELMKIEDICMYSTENYTDEERKILCKDCNISCKYNPTTWSEEDKIITSAILQLLKGCESENGWNCVYSNDREVFFVDIEKWLKSLKDKFSIHQNNLSADDEINYRILQRIICNSDTSSTLANKLSDWLDSLKNRAIPQPKEWSKEDEE